MAADKLDRRMPKKSRPQRNWLAHLWHEWLFELRRPIQPATARPTPNEWPDGHLTAAWLGHATVLLNFFGVTILTDPVLFARCGVRFPFFTVGPKRMTEPALTIDELPPIDLVLLSHAHFDHLDTRTLHRFHAAHAGRDGVADPRSAALDKAPRNH